MCAKNSPEWFQHYHGMSPTQADAAARAVREAGEFARPPAAAPTAAAPAAPTAKPVTVEKTVAAQGVEVHVQVAVIPVTPLVPEAASVGG